MGWQLARQVEHRKRPGLQQVSNFFAILVALVGYLFKLRAYI